jgi:UDP-glucose-4-epimerase GalE
MRVLVTGGAGFIGTETARHLLARGDAVAIVDRRAPLNASVVPGAEIIRGDVRDDRFLERAFVEFRPQAVIHLAGEKSVEASLANPGEYFDSNVHGSIVTLRAAQRAGVRAFVFSSSAAVYGVPERLPVDEDSVLRPQTPYGETKLLVERMLPWFDRCAGIRFVSLRYFNAAGAALDGRSGEDWNDARNLVPIVMKAALGQIRAVEIFGTDYPTPDGTAVRDYIHVADLADAHIRAIDYLADGGSSAILNVGTGRGASVREVIDATSRVAGQAVPVVLGPRRAGDAAAVWADVSRAEAVLGWRARLGLDEIVETAWRWHAWRAGDESRLSRPNRAGAAAAR